MHRLLSPVLMLVLLALAPAAVTAADFMPAIVFDMGGKFDKSFNQMAYEGAEAWRKENGIAYREFEVTSPVQREQALRQLARRGAAIVIAIGFSQGPAVATVAKEFPNTKFTVIDAIVDAPNVQSVVMREQEGSFLVGMLAAMKSQTGKVGFVGGMDIPLIRKFAAGYRQGALYVNPKIEVLENMTGTTPEAWNDPTRGAELAKAQFGRGVDVIYAAAGGTGLGVYQAAKDAGKYAIGVDSNQNYVQPGTMLTSMVKRIDKVVGEAFTSARDGSWQPGTRDLGLAADAVGWALDQYNRPLITAEMEERCKQATADIVAGKIKVSETCSNAACTN
ncbi:BMP family lipoprotein [Roseiterribacter gracilis]|uniref:BMP family ABC transporter substrate-binding protein n=1 Tax=Roseiterribacter gracilis TaxID=2812848 RepID=A0A8S8XM55_9PROT|nr:BMP family ABC transporter substrate-binding protein [Rhodospirillales bacterium TMPK1]